MSGLKTWFTANVNISVTIAKLIPNQNRHQPKLRAYERFSREVSAGVTITEPQYEKCEPGANRQYEESNSVHRQSYYDVIGVSSVHRVG